MTLAEKGMCPKHPVPMPTLMHDTMWLISFRTLEFRRRTSDEKALDLKTPGRANSRALLRQRAPLFLRIPLLKFEFKKNRRQRNQEMLDQQRAN